MTISHSPLIKGPPRIANPNGLKGINYQVFTENVPIFNWRIAGKANVTNQYVYRDIPKNTGVYEYLISVSRIKAGSGKKKGYLTDQERSHIVDVLEQQQHIRVISNYKSGNIFVCHVTQETHVGRLDLFSHDDDFIWPADKI